MEEFDNVDVTEIQGIGPASAAALGDIAVFHVFDLLRADTNHLHAAVSNLASVEQVQAWREMASLLRVRGMNSQWAEALVKANMGSVAQLRGQSVEELGQIFAEAKANQIIPDTPSISVIAEMKADAAALHYSGAIYGKVTKQNGSPLNNCKVRFGFEETTTNQYGRFNLFRLPLGRNLALFIEKSNYQTLVVNQPNLLVNDVTVQTEIFTLQSSTAASTQSDQILREIDGDELPVPSGHRVRQKTHTADQVVNGDILKVRYFYKRSSDVNLVSRFKTYDNGEFMVDVYRIPESDLPDDLEIGNHVRYSNDQFEKIDMNSETLRVELARRRMSKIIRSQPRATTADGLKNMVSFFVREMISQGLLRRLS